MSDHPIYDKCLADFTARHGHAPGKITATGQALAKMSATMKAFADAAVEATVTKPLKAAPRKTAAKKTTTRRKR